MAYDFTQKHPFRLIPLSDERFEYREEEAEKPIQFIERFFRQSQDRWSGTPLKLQEWQKGLIRELFGWYYKDTERLQYKEAYIQLPRKAGKTTLIAALGIYKLIKDIEKGAQVVVAASTKDQARICFDLAKAAVIQDEYLAKRLKPARYWIESKGYAMPSVFKAVPADAGALHGMNVSFGIIDELHTHPNRDVYDAIKTSQGARENPMVITITTPGNDKTTFCYEVYEYCKDLLSKTVDNPSFLPVIFGLSEDDDWKNRDNWYKASPNLGVTVSVEYLEEKFTKAKDIPSEANSFKQLDLGMWVEQSSPWLPVERWTEAIDKNFDQSLLEGKPCYMGLDLSSNDDLTAIALIWPNVGLDNDKTFVRTWSFIPKASVWETDKATQFSYNNWVKNRHLHTTDGEIINYNQIKEFILSLSKQYKVMEIACDPWNSRQLMSELQDNHKLTVIDTRQHAAAQHPGIQHFERLLLSNKLVHEGNPINTWQFGNLSVKIDDEGKIKFLKENRKRKIDAMAAIANAFTRVIVNVKEPARDKYVDWGFM